MVIKGNFLKGFGSGGVMVAFTACMVPSMVVAWYGKGKQQLDGMMKEVNPNR